ncbi:MAG: tRNA (adenosine(37)-N6)-threonylcarbamoyltransferase complex dimerization subunit type 1 TsaB [Mogibacterium sp.]|nr:tRNA (adenosine(37)-N6)-threonylcarbamoyltransferase complex dimerization subunit type 1 TsaB [Mogibacterium sp.]
MYILALETTGRNGSAAVIDEAGVCVSSSSSEEMNHLKDIITLTDECLRKRSISTSELTHIAASIGPGSFTGIRIGVTTARAMAQVLGLPCVSVRTLESMACAAVPYAKESGADQICTIINARRHQTYAALWDAGASDDLEPQRQYMIEEMLDLVRARGGRTIFTGDGIDAYETIIRERLDGTDYLFAPEEIRYQSAASAAVIARRKVLAGEVLRYDELLPDYMRKSEAEMRLEAGTLSRKIRG